MKPRISFARQTTNAAEAITGTHKSIGKWLLACSGMCFGAVVIGGITRLF